jgi:glutathione S-transferase
LLDVPDKSSPCVRQGQANHFLRAAKERIPWGIQRYVGETERLYGILDAHLANRDYIVGPGKGRFSIADISLLGWVNASPNATLERIVKDKFVNLWGWFQRCVERPAVKRGFNVPPGPPRGLLAGEGGSQDEKARKVTEDLVEEAKKAKEKYGYKYSSP